MDKMSVLLPAYNEEQTIGECIDEALECGVLPDNILVGDNNCTDMTAVIARNKGVRVIYVKDKGKGYVIHELIKYIRTPYAVVVDSDGTYPINSNISAMRYLLEKYAAVLTYRQNYSEESMSRLHRFGNWGFSMLISVLYFHYIKDSLSGMWGFRAELAQKINFGKGGFIPDVDFVTGAITNRAKIYQIPISYFPRQSGSKAKIRFIDGIVILKRIITRRLKW